MIDKKITQLAKENLLISQKKAARSKTWPVDKREEDYVEQQKKKDKTTQEADKQFTADPQDSMEGVLSTIVQKVKESSNPSADETKEEANKKKDANT